MRLRPALRKLKVRQHIRKRCWLTQFGQRNSRQFKLRKKPSLKKSPKHLPPFQHQRLDTHAEEWAYKREWVCLMTNTNMTQLGYVHTWALPSECNSHRLSVL